jgi:predicted RNA binding protein YcfA (HicA-like mRNA interferase family)
MENKKALEGAIDEIASSTAPSFNRLLNICEDFFGNYRVKGSHHIFKTPWHGDPRINLQKGKGKDAKPYQVQQVLKALRKLRDLEIGEKNEQRNEKRKKSR